MSKLAKVSKYVMCATVVRLLEFFKEPSILVLNMFQNRRTMSSGSLKKSESKNWATSVILKKSLKDLRFFFS